MWLDPPCTHAQFSLSVCMASLLFMMKCVCVCGLLHFPLFIYFILSFCFMLGNTSSPMNIVMRHTFTIL